ncbi:hypothetical protein ACFDTO_22125 [Microbacteriaceae bacterium 4G12]
MEMTVLDAQVVVHYVVKVDHQEHTYTLLVRDVDNVGVLVSLFDTFEGQLHAVHVESVLQKLLTLDEATRESYKYDARETGWMWAEPGPEFDKVYKRPMTKAEFEVFKFVEGNIMETNDLH